MQKESYYSILCDLIIDELEINDYLLDLDKNFLKGRQRGITELARRLVYKNLETSIEELSDSQFIEIILIIMELIIKESKTEKESESVNFIKGLYYGFGEILQSIVNHYSVYEFLVEGQKIDLQNIENMAYRYIIYD